MRKFVGELNGRQVTNLQMSVGTLNSFTIYGASPRSLFLNIPPQLELQDNLLFRTKVSIAEVGKDIDLDEHLEKIKLFFHAFNRPVILCKSWYWLRSLEEIK